MHRNTLALILLAAAAPLAQAQTSRTPGVPHGRMMQTSDDGDRALLGVSTSSSGRRDTLGLLIESVTPGSPADKAGLEEGNRIVSINGVSLKLSKEDAGEPDMSGTMTNRLVREMRKVKAGDEVSLEIWADGHRKSVKAKTIAAEDLSPERMTRQSAEERPVLGISLGSNGSKRDTLGVFVSSVNDNGPAEKAGIAEGDRIASINGVDLRVSKDDIGDWGVANARVQRLQREVHKLKPGQTAELVVVEGGRSRNVKVTVGRAKDIERENGFSYSTGDGGMFIGTPHIPAVPPMPPMPSMAPMPPSHIRVYDDRDGDVDVNLDGVRATLESLRDIGPRIRDDIEPEVRRAIERAQEQIPMIRARIGRRVII